MRVPWAQINRATQCAPTGGCQIMIRYTWTIMGKMFGECHDPCTLNTSFVDFEKQISTLPGRIPNKTNTIFIQKRGISNDTCIILIQQHRISNNTYPVALQESILLNHACRISIYPGIIQSHTYEIPIPTGIRLNHAWTSTAGYITK